MVERSAKAYADLRSPGIELNDLFKLGEILCFRLHPRDVQLKKKKLQLGRAFLRSFTIETSLH